MEAQNPSNSQTSLPRKAGRPVGSVESPQNLAIRDFRASLKLKARLRDTVEKLVDDVEHQLATASMPLASKLNALKALASAMDSLTRAEQQSLKHILTEANDESVSPESSSAVIKEILGERRK